MRPTPDGVMRQEDLRRPHLRTSAVARSHREPAREKGNGRQADTPNSPPGEASRLSERPLIGIRRTGQHHAASKADRHPSVVSRQLVEGRHPPHRAASRCTQSKPTSVGSTRNAASAASTNHDSRDRRFAQLLLLVKFGPRQDRDQRGAARRIGVALAWEIPRSATRRDGGGGRGADVRRVSARRDAGQGGTQGAPGQRGVGGGTCCRRRRRQAPATAAAHAKGSAAAVEMRPGAAILPTLVAPKVLPTVPKPPFYDPKSEGSNPPERAKGLQTGINGGRQKKRFRVTKGHKMGHLRPVTTAKPPSPVRLRSPPPAKTPANRHLPRRDDSCRSPQVTVSADIRAT
jgi:hypothetical protein